MAKIERELEVEHKALVSLERYEKLMEELLEFSEFKEEYVQVNHFFDTKDWQLDKAKVTLRIRFKKEKYQLTAKIGKGKKGDKFQTGKELNTILSEEEALEFLQKGELPLSLPLIKEMEEETNIKINEPIQLLGPLITTRRDYLRGTDTISLDKNEYNGQLDYEIEWETIHHDYVKEKNKKLKLPFGNAKGKRKRFLQTLKS